MPDRGADSVMSDSLEKSSWDARPGRPRRAARTGLFIVAGGASSAMMDSSEIKPGRKLGRPGGTTAPCHGRTVPRPPLRGIHMSHEKFSFTIDALRPQVLTQII